MSAVEGLQEALAENAALRAKLAKAGAWYEGYAAGTRDTAKLFKSPPWKTPPATPNPYEETSDE